MKLGTFFLGAASAFDFLEGTTHKCGGLNSGDGGRIGNVDNELMTIEKRMHMALTTEKIVGGRQVEDMKNWNWIGQLGGYCGGSLVADDMFLTAAHCCASTRIGQTIYFGVLNPWKDQSKSQKRKVKEMLNHPDFVRSTLTHDICMIQLDSPIDRTRTVRPICLSESAPVKNTPLYVAGWGLTEEGGQQSRDLMEVSVPIVTNKQCQSAYSHRPVDDSMVCAGKVEGGEDGCQGDSGGPIVTVDGEGNVSLAGVVSWGVGCARPGKFGVYSRVDTQLDFIHWSIQTLRGDYDGSLNSFDLSKNSLSGSQMPNPGGEPEISTDFCNSEQLNLHEGVRVRTMAGKKGSQKFEFSCSTGVRASVTELSCYDDGNFYESKADKKKRRPFDTNTVIDCLDGNSGGGNSLEEACNTAFDDFFKKKGIHAQYFGELQSTTNGLEQKFMCATQAKTMMIACKEGKRGNVIVGLLGGKTTKKAIKKC